MSRPICNPWCVDPCLKQRRCERDGGDVTQIPMHFVRRADDPPAPTRPIAEMGMAPEDHWREDARTGVLLHREPLPFQQGYVQGWWWGVCCGAVAAALTSAAAVIGWATWWH